MEFIKKIPVCELHGLCASTERGKSGFVSALCALQLIVMMHDTY